MLHLSQFSILHHMVQIFSQILHYDCYCLVSYYRELWSMVRSNFILIYYLVPN